MKDYSQELTHLELAIGNVKMEFCVNCGWRVWGCCLSCKKHLCSVCLAWYHLKGRCQHGKRDKDDINQ